MIKKKVAIINYGLGNLVSIENALRYLKINNKIISNPKDLKNFSHLILPGVGSFSTGMKNITKFGWDEEIKKFYSNRKLILGICLGMQMLFSDSNEFGLSNGLGLIQGKCRMFSEETKNKIVIPHVGFNQVVFPETVISSGIDKNSSFYFIHSYRIKKVEPNVRYGYTTYGEKFISFVEKNNVFGTQFHPEKSHTAGLKLLKNFVNINKC